MYDKPLQTGDAPKRPREIENPLRRKLITTLPILPLMGTRAFAEEVVDLNWSDLLPDSSNAIPYQLRGLIEHNEASLASQQPSSSGIKTDWNGQTIRLPGYIVPIDYSGKGVVAFILVPFVGACVHVPPPPANQLVFVTTQTPTKLKGCSSRSAWSECLGYPPFPQV